MNALVEHVENVKVVVFRKTVGVLKHCTDE